MTSPGISRTRKADLTRLFQPETIAHVGASPRPAVGRFSFTKYLLTMNYPGRLYPVNPKYEEVHGLRCYPSLADIPDDVDLAILAVPSLQCASALREAPQGKVKFVIIHTSGFGEIRKAELEKELLELAQAKGFRIIGPNCMGIYSQEGRVGFWQDHWEIVNKPGSVGFISQSGGHAVNLLMGGMDTGIFFNKVISLGNQLDLTIHEVLEYMGKDPAIGVIGIYVEDVRDGNRFLGLLKDIVPGKPVVVWKGGTSAVGKEAVLSHTGSLAGDEAVFSAAMRQAGALLVDNFDHMVRLIRLLQPQFGLPAGSRLAIFSPGGGNTVSACDLFSSQPGLSLPPFGAETREKLKTLLPEENVDIRNPVDPGATGAVRIDQLMRVVSQDPQIDAILVLIGVDYLSNIKGEESRALAAEMISDLIATTVKQVKKPITVLLQQVRQNHEDFDRYRRIMLSKFIEKRIPWIDGSFKDAAQIYAQVAQYRNHLARLRQRESFPDGRETGSF